MPIESAPSPINRAMSPEVHPPEEPNHVSRILELDGLRGVAALAVFCHHVLFTSTPHPERWGQPVSAVVWLSQAGAYGVDLFFVLSGFLITSIILTDRSRPHYYWNFYWRRALRILPLYGTILILLATLYPGTRRYVLLAALFLANFERLFHLGAYGPFWTLAIEEQFYLFWPRVARYRSLKGLARLAMGVAATCLALRLADTLIGHHNYRFTFFHCDGLAMGAVLACQVAWLRANPPSPAASTQRERRVLALTALAGLTLAGIASAFPSESRLGITLEAFRLTGASLIAYCAVRLAVLFSGAGFLAILRSRVLVFFGMISYALYMLHEYMMGYYQHVFGVLHVGDTRAFFQRGLLILAATTALGVFSQFVIERPGMWLRRYVLRKS